MLFPGGPSSSTALQRAGVLVHVGTVVVDVVVRVEALPLRGGDVLADSAGATAGGGFNVMVAAARLGLPVVYAGGHGTGPFSDLARAELAAAGITVLRPPRPADTGLVITIVDGGGERTFLTSPAAVVGPSPADLAAVSPDAGDTVYVSGYGLLEPGSRDALVPWVRALPGGVRVVLDPGPLAPAAVPAALAAVAERADWYTANAHEAATITGVADPMRAAVLLGGRAGAIVRTGADGCVLAVAGAAPVAVPGFPVRAVDTTGAGDAHTGAFLAATALGAAPPAAARTANAAAALSVTRAGPATAPTAAELAEFLRQRTTA